MREFLILLQARSFTLKNYFLRRLDCITRIEIVLFLGFIFYYTANNVNQQINWILKNQGQEALTSFYYLFHFWGALLLLSSAAAYSKRQIRSTRNSVLLIQPVRTGTAAWFLTIEVTVLFALLIPWWLTVQGLLVFRMNLDPVVQIILFFNSFLYYIAIVVTGVYLGILFNVIAKKSFVLEIFVGICFACALGVFLVKESVFDKMIPFLGQTVVLMVFGIAVLVLTVALLKRIILLHPEKLATADTGIKIKSGAALIKWYCVLTPKKIHPLVLKDCIYMLRNFKLYFVLFISFLAACIIGIDKVETLQNAVQWYISMVIAAGYVFANASFRLSENEAENLALIRTQNISPRQYWCAKFWNGMLPVIWLFIAGFITVLVMHKPGFFMLTGSAFVAIFIAFTLVFIGTNFSLYSFPYSRYAVMWYNLYLVVALLFFTILLFPFLSVGFLLFGYLFIFLVLKRIKNVEIANDYN